ncbi:hypothetical protein SCA6_012652 [Theobroma cacao]
MSWKTLSLLSIFFGKIFGLLVSTPFPGSFVGPRTAAMIASSKSSLSEKGFVWSPISFTLMELAEFPDLVLLRVSCN